MVCAIENKGVVFDIVKYAVHDGPGIRTTVFLKGCPLKCLWCQNPESQRAEPERVGDVHGRKYSGIFFTKDKNFIGHEFTVQQVISEVKKDMVFYEHSRGGVTFSGGEPLMQPDFLFGLLKESKKHGMHTAVDTSGHAPWPVFKRIMKHVDLFLYDLKLMDDREHLKYTGVSNRLIVDNLKRLARGSVQIVIRLPVIVGITDRPANLRSIGLFVRGIKNIETIHLLPYNYLCKEKYNRMKIKYLFKHIEPPSGTHLRKIKKQLEAYDLRVGIRGLE
jgi:pyruvate formate lyase activating enzyme